MKTFLPLVLVCLLAAGAALAGRPAANIRLQSERGVPFAVLLDGRPLSRGLVRQVRAERLAPGTHYVEFSVPTGRGRAVRLQSRVWLEPGLETTFVLIARPGWPLSLRSVGAAAIYRPGYRVPDRCQVDDTWRGPAYGSASDRDRDYDTGDYRGQAYPSDSYQSERCQSNLGNPAGGYSRDLPTSGADYTGPATGEALLAASEIRELTQELSQVSREDEQLRVARRALQQRSIYAADLAQVLRSLRTDETRVELAKFAHPLVADQQNFYRVYAAFYYNASAREVEQAVAAN